MPTTENKERLRRSRTDVARPKAKKRINTVADKKDEEEKAESIRRLNRISGSRIRRKTEE